MNVHDSITNAGVDEVSIAAFRAIDSLQDEHPGIQPAAVALLLYLLCRRYNEDPAFVLLTASNRFNTGAANSNQHMQALAHYMKVDLPGQANALKFNF